jgi:hypothetical protein
LRTALLHLARPLAAIALLTSPALAADPKPDATIRTRAVEVNVFLDAKIKADAAMAADCLAEARKWLDKNAADAAKEMKQDPQFSRDGGWSFERKYSVRSVVADRYVSIVRDDYMDTHGAHPNTDVNTILWDKTESKRISIRPFLTETTDNGPTMTAMQKAIIVSLRAERSGIRARPRPQNGSRASNQNWSRSAR